MLQKYYDLDLQKQQITALMRGEVQSFIRETNKAWLEFWKNKLKNGESIEIEFTAFKPSNTEFNDSVLKDVPPDMIEDFYATLLSDNGYSILTIGKIDDHLEFRVTIEHHIRF